MSILSNLGMNVLYNDWRNNDADPDNDARGHIGVTAT